MHPKHLQESSHFEQIYHFVSDHIFMPGSLIQGSVGQMINRVDLSRDMPDVQIVFLHGRKPLTNPRVH